MQVDKTKIEALQSSEVAESLVKAEDLQELEEETRHRDSERHKQSIPTSKCPPPCPFKLLWR